MRPTLPARVQERLARTYGIDGTPLVDDFIQPTEGPAREALFIRHDGDAIEVALRLPREAIDGGRAPSFDEICQVVEGVSHFLYVAERARRELPATQLELELQAEVDKYVLLACSGIDRARRFDPERAARVRARLFERVLYLHPPESEAGQRYRTANDLAARFARRIEAELARGGRVAQTMAVLRRFYAAGQADKIALAIAA